MPADLVISDVWIANAANPHSGPADVLIEHGKIVAIEPAGTFAGTPHRRYSADGGVLLPGLVNAHLHSHELFMKGTVWGLPLEPYILRILPRLAPEELPTTDDVYYRTLAAAIEMVTGGTTLAVDDVIHPVFAPEYVDAVLQAYHDSGMRASVTIMLENRPWTESIPFVEGLSETPLAAIGRTSDASVADLIRFCGDAIDRWNERSDRARVILSPSAPQRCTAELLQGLAALARDRRIPNHVHVQETPTQAATGPHMFGQSMVSYLASLDVLDTHTTIAHGVWLDDADIRMIATAGATVIHNPVSNLKLGSGVARIRDLLDAGVNVALGCDGYTCNDTQDMLEAMKQACLLSCIASEDPDRWLAPVEALQMATLNGARANFWDNVGEIREGAVADMVVLRATAHAFNPLNNPLNQAVFSARVSDVQWVFVGGELVAEDGKSLLVSEERTRSEVNAAAHRFWERARRSLEENEALMPKFRAAYERGLREIPTTTPYRLVPEPGR